MKKIRSGFYKKRKRNRSIKMVKFDIFKKAKKLFSKDLLNYNKKRSSSFKKKQYLRKDIFKKQFHNPEQKKIPFFKAFKRRLLKQRFKIAQLFLAVILFSWFSVVFIKPTFYLTTVRIEGTEEINPDDIKALAYEHIGKRSLFSIKRAHIFFLKDKKLAKNINEQYSLDSLEFSTHWPSKTLSIHIKEKVSVIHYSVKGQYFALDSDGRVIREVPEEEGLENKELPIIYQYADISAPSVGEIVFNPATIQTVDRLNEELNKYPGLEVHSYRLKESEQRKIVLKDKRTNDTGAEDTSESEEAREALLDEALQNIAQAQTTSEKILSLQEALENIEIEKLEEQRVEELLREQKEFIPKDDYMLLELEVYTNAGWSIRFGHEVLKDASQVEKYLNIFATLAGEVDLAGEVNEYVDLRFPNRIYYR